MRLARRSPVDDAWARRHRQNSRLREAPTWAMLPAMKTIGGLDRFQGTLIRPDDDGYDAARGLWNAAIDRRPALIARCVDADDAAVALANAREAGLPIAV